MITLTPEQIDAGRKAALARPSQWKSTTQEAVALAHQLWQERGRFRATVECVAVAKVAGTSHVGIRNRYLMGEPAQAFAAGQLTCTRADGSVRYVNDDLNYQNGQGGWWWALGNRCRLTRGLRLCPIMVGEDAGTCRTPELCASFSRFAA